MKPYSASLLDRILFNLPSLWAKVCQCFVKKKPLHVLTSEETLRKIIETKCSVARFGDGEWRIMRGGGIGFQRPNKALARRLREIIRKPDERCLVCISNVFNGIDHFVPTAKAIWRRILCLQDAWVRKIFGGEYSYGDALISRFYIDTQDLETAQQCISLWKQVWNKRDVLIVEGEFSRLGVDSNLFANAASVKRILCPAIHAWDAYQDIYSAVKKHAQGKLVLIALGPTATILAYDLALQNIQAVDCGHFEVEYQWMLMKAKTKVSIPNRWVNEVKEAFNKEHSSDVDYQDEIVDRIHGDE